MDYTTNRDVFMSRVVIFLSGYILKITNPTVYLEDSALTYQGSAINMFNVFSYSIIDVV